MSLLKNQMDKARRICIMGVGNPQKGDDGAGPLVIKKLLSLIKKQRLKNILFIDCGEMPENFSGSIRKFQPDLTIIIDASISGRKPGTTYIVEPRNINFDDVSTHRLPLSIFVQFLEQTMPTKVIIIGIEPQNLNFGDEFSPEVKYTIEEMVVLLNELICNWILYSKHHKSTRG